MFPGCVAGISSSPMTSDNSVDKDRRGRAPAACPRGLGGGLAAGGLAASDAMVSSDNVRANVLWFRLNLVLMWCCWLRAGLGFVYAPRGCAFRHTFRGAFCETRSAAAIGKAFWI